MRAAPFRKGAARITHFLGSPSSDLDQCPPRRPARQSVAMSHRVFTDSAGTTWEVWDVVPGRLLLEARNHRTGTDRRVAQQSLPDEGERRRGGDRRATLAPQLRHGWLAFRNGEDERRRLAPIPALWEEATNAELERWCAAAELVVEVRRQQRR